MIRRAVFKLSRLLEYVGLLLRFPADGLHIIKLLFTNRPYLGEWVRFADAAWLRDEQIETVIDVGAFTGSLCFGISRLIPGVRMFAFEPLPENFQKLEELALTTHLTPFNVAVGNEEGMRTFYRNRFTASSSALPMADRHVREFPETAEVEEVTVPFWRLDDHQEVFDLTGRVLLVLDVQGYEFEVLKGAEALLKRIDLIITEVSVDELYEQQTSFDQLYTWLKARGFTFRGDFDRLVSRDNGRPLQIDAIFQREEGGSS